jgi:NACalpha-BTF3-like transcription factor
LKFNRGALLNIGFNLSNARNYSGVIFHDIDLLPKMNMAKHYNEALFLENDNKSIVHLAHAWTRYQPVGERFIGGVLIMKSNAFQDINGFPTFFEGWGGEDEALLKRYERYNDDRQLNISIQDMIKRPTDITFSDFEDLENINTIDDKMNMLMRNPKQLNDKVNESLELDKENGSIYGVRNSDNTYIITSKQLLQNQDNMILHKVQLNKNFVSYDLIHTMRGDENMKIEDSEEEEEEDEDLPPLNITNEDVKIPVDKISQDMQEIAPTLTEMETDIDMNSVDQEAMGNDDLSGIKIIK